MIGELAIGVAAGMIAGLLGVGGGVLFVPGLVLFAGLSQHRGGGDVAAGDRPRRDRGHLPAGPLRQRGCARTR